MSKDALRKNGSPEKPLDNSEWDLGSIQDFTSGIIEALTYNADLAPYLKGILVGNIVAGAYHHEIFRATKKEEVLK